MFSIPERHDQIVLVLRVFRVFQGDGESSGEVYFRDYKKISAVCAPPIDLTLLERKEWVEKEEAGTAS